MIEVIRIRHRHVQGVVLLFDGDDVVRFGNLFSNHVQSTALNRDAIEVDKGVAHLLSLRHEHLSLTDHPKLDDYRVENIFRALEQLTLSDVEPASKPRDQKIGVATYTLVDGTVIVVTLFHADKDIWAELAASGEKSATLQAGFAGWRFQLGSWKEKSFLPVMDDLKASEPETPAP